jgi:hypothetical protein
VRSRDTPASERTGPVSAPLEQPRTARVLMVTATWGGCFVLIRWDLRDAPVLWFAALRSLLAGAVLLAVAGLTRRPFPRDGRSWTVIAALALRRAGVGFAVMFGAVERESEHPLALAIVPEAERRSVRTLRADHFGSVPGHGAIATVDGQRVVVGTPAPHGTRIDPARHVERSPRRTHRRRPNSRTRPKAVSVLSRPSPWWQSSC